MSRVGKQPIQIPSGVNILINDRIINVQGRRGSLNLELHAYVNLEQSADSIHLFPVRQEASHWAMCGTMRSILNNMIIGVTIGFEKKLQLVGVGYRAQAQGQKLNLLLGFSHPIEFSIPVGISIETPSQSEIIIKGSDKQQVGEVAAKLRAYRSPEPYKGKGIRYMDERILMKEAKKK
ncbi:50S ribosomal protein L6 [uncultured Cardiobacterium sp.]|uniref:50S ribosomal protein L6 n=1 Tax=uncultured Cardiobacterium sp. TaxID=417619 RepID=UPI0026310814|nr:50S ribosomal protein L6 [uncultured Cardiobacterium sp.]